MIGNKILPMRKEPMQHEILEFLKQLAAAQEKTLTVLQKKQALLVKPDEESLAYLAVEEEDAHNQFKQSLEQRQKILASACEQGLRADSIQVLCEQLFPMQIEWRKTLDASIARSQQIRYLAFTNWTMSQKSLAHLTKMLEIIETKGLGKTTYNPQSKESPHMGGGFVDRVA
jgi:hypothetical protein